MNAQFAIFMADLFLQLTYGTPIYIYHVIDPVAMSAATGEHHIKHQTTKSLTKTLQVYLFQASTHIFKTYYCFNIVLYSDLVIFHI